MRPRRDPHAKTPPAPPPTRGRLWLALGLSALIGAAIAAAVVMATRGPSPMEEIRALLVVQRVGQARQELESLLAEDAANVEARVLLAGVLQSQGDRAGALRELEQAVQTDPDHAEARVNLGNLLGSMNRPEEAIPHLERAIALTEGSSEEARAHGLALVNLAQAYDAVNDMRSADDAWERALRANHGREDVARAAARYAVRRQRWPAAVQILQVLARRTPNDRALQLELAESLLALGRSGEAIAPLERAVLLDTSDLNTAYNLASLKYEQGSREAARILCERILEVSPEHALANQLLPFCRDLVIQFDAGTGEVTP